MHSRLFVSHGTVVNVVDLQSGKVMHTIPDTRGVHGIALAYDLNKGFISSGKDTSVTIFNLSTFEMISKVKVTGRNPDAILYDPFTQRVFTFNGGTSNATVIDANTGKVVGTIALEGKPEFPTTDGKGKIYVNIEDKSKINVIDAKTLKVTAQWPIAPGEEPSGLAFDNTNHRLFSVCDNKMMVVTDALSGKVITTLPTGERTDGAAFDPALHLAFSANGEGTLTIVREESGNKFTVEENLPTAKGARTIAINEKTHHHLYLPAAEYGPTPEPTKENPRPRPALKPNSFFILDVAPTK